VRRLATRILGLVVLLGMVPASPPAGAGAAPDLILHDALVLTMNAEAPSASAIAVAGDRIVAVGSDAEVLPLAGPGTSVVDLDGRSVTPGFIDSHSHWIGDRGLFGVGTAQEAIQMALEGGWTSINELFVNQDRLDELTSLDAAGELRLRVNAYFPVNYTPNQHFGFWFSELTPGAQAGPRLRYAGAKFFIDDCGPNSYYLSEPRDDGDRGQFNIGTAGSCADSSNGSTMPAGRSPRTAAATERPTRSWTRSTWRSRANRAGSSAIGWST